MIDDFRIDILGSYFGRRTKTLTFWVLGIGDGDIDGKEWNLILFGIYGGKPTLHLFGIHIFGIKGPILDA